MVTLRCPGCGDRLVKPAREGGHMIKSHTVRVTEEGQTVLSCPTCKTSLSVESKRLVFFPKKVV